MPRFLKFLILLAVLSVPRLAFAQGAVAQAPGAVTQYDFACWYGNGLIFDCGLSSLSPVTLPATPTGSLLGNATGSTTAAQVTALTALIDSICPGVAQGNLIYRDVAAWQCLATGTSGYFLQSNGFAANPSWAAAAGTTYSADGTTLSLSGNTFSLITPVAVASGGTGLASGTSGGVLGYTASGTLASSAALTAHGLVLGGGAGATPYPIASLGTSGQVLQSNGPSADPSWGAVASGTVTSIATASGITGGTITATGTISCVSATSSTEGCVTPDGTATHFLNGAGSWVAATNANYVTLSGTAQALTGGFHPTEFSNGTATTGTKTIDCGNGPLQSLTNGGNFTLALNTSASQNCRLIVVNNGSAGTITFSGFSEGSNTGDALTTTNGNVFAIVLDYSATASAAHYLVSAYQ